MRLWSAAFFASALLVMNAPAHAVMEDYPSVKLQGLDKSVGRTVTFEAKVGSTIQYGTLYIKIQSCRKSQPIDKPESAAFVQIWEVPPGAKKSEWIFSGWLFASSPALSAVDHPVYDVWVLDCLGKEQPNEEAQKAETKEEADQGNLTPAGAQAPAPATDGAAPPSPAQQGEGQPGAPASVSPADPAPGTEENVPAGNGAAAAPDASASPGNSTGANPPTMAPALPGAQAPVTAPGTMNQLPAPQIQEEPNRDDWTAYDFMREQQNPRQAPGPAPAIQPAAPTYNNGSDPQSDNDPAPVTDPYAAPAPEHGQSSEPQEVEEEAPNY